MVILEDKGQQEGKHVAKHRYFLDKEIEILKVPLPVGDYILQTERTSEVIERKSKRGIALKKMDFLGTYDYCVDTKKDIQEIINNICGKQHARFRDECILAKNNSIKLVILVENKDGVYCVDDLFHWYNPMLRIMKTTHEIIGTTRGGYPKHKKVQKFPTATKGSTLAKACITMQSKYGVEFQFCRPEEAGERILSILNMKLEE